VAIEEEVKLAFDDVEAARRAVATAGGRLVVSRRLIEDRLFDTADGWLRRARLSLRVRRDGADAYLTFKGAPRTGPVKSREEIETHIDDAAIGEALVSALGFRPAFRSQKYREEFALGATRVAIDETPMGVYIEVEGAPADIESAANSLGRSRHDYVLASYPELHADWRRRRNLEPGDCVFPSS
jgi:adenylate cyclase class 2